MAVAPKTKGLVVRVVDGDDALELQNATGANVMVPGYEGEPYLRFLKGGRVEVNVELARQVPERGAVRRGRHPEVGGREGDAEVAARRTGRRVRMARAPDPLDVDDRAAAREGERRERRS